MYAPCLLRTNKAPRLCRLTAGRGALTSEIVVRIHAGAPATRCPRDRAHQGVAQLAEYRTWNPGVAGSSPAALTTPTTTNSTPAIAGCVRTRAVEQNGNVKQ